MVINKAIGKYIFDGKGIIRSTIKSNKTKT